MNASSQDPGRESRSTLGKLAAGLLVTLVVFGTLEGIARFVIQHGIDQSQEAEEETNSALEAPSPTQDLLASHSAATNFKDDPVLGWVWRDLPDRKMGLNAHGFRYGPVEKTKEDRTWRAFALGDSQTFGAHLSANDTYSAHAERFIQEAVGDEWKVQVINAGLSGYSSLQVLRLVESRLLEWSPDLLVVDCKPFDSPEERQEVVDAGTQDLRLRRVPHLVYLIRLLLDRGKYTPEKVEEAPPNEGTGKLKGNHHRIEALAAEHGVQVVFLDYPQVELSGYVQCHSAMRQVSSRAVVADVCTPLMQDSRPSSQLFYDTNHLSEAGAEIVGRVLADTILERDIGPGGTGPTQRLDRRGPPIHGPPADFVDEAKKP